MSRRLLVLWVVALCGCAKPWAFLPSDHLDPAPCQRSSGVTHTVFLVGDAGAPKLPGDDAPELVDPVLLQLQADVQEAVRLQGADQTGVLFLGDNVYPRGLVPEGHRDRRRGERVLEAQILASQPAWIVFIAGNHDWDREGANGWDYVLAQREFLAKQGPRVAMRPPGGCAGPAVIEFGRYLRFVLIDPIGYTHLEANPELHAGLCPQTNLRDAYLALAHEFRNPEGHHVVLGMHHPLVTAGPHGGHYTLRQHVFPLTDFWPWAWLPLPIIGSAYPLSRQLGVTTTDLSSDQYTGYITGILRAATPWSPTLVAAGHEHSLQVHRDWLEQTYAVSGAGSYKKPNRVEPMDTLMHAAPGSARQAAWARPGYMRLDTHRDGSLDLTVRALEGDDGARDVFHTCIADGPPSYEGMTR